MQISARPRKRVPLTNDGALTLYFIGTGSAFARTLNQNNLLVVKGREHLLIDCGATCFGALSAVGITTAEVRNFLITHSHADHIGGLEEAMMSGRYIHRKTPTMIITRAYEKILWEQSLRGGAGPSEVGGLEFADFWNVERPRKQPDAPRETFHHALGDLDIKMPRTKHIPEGASSWRSSAWSCGVILDNRVLYTSDTRFDPELLASFDDRYGFDVIFHDCQTFRGGVHASIHELLDLPLALRERMVLMHYGDDWHSIRKLARQGGFHSFAKQGHSYTF